jgi:low affinity Fe/Cu permease
MRSNARKQGNTNHEAADAPPSDDSSTSRHPTRHFFQAFSTRAALALGTKWAFLIAIASIAVWALLGPVFHYSDTWQLVVNTATTIITFLMVFVIQNTQNRDARALHLKLDELIHAVKSAKNEMIDIEKLPDDVLDSLAVRYGNMRKNANRTTRDS